MLIITNKQHTSKYAVINGLLMIEKCLTLKCLSWFCILCTLCLSHTCPHSWRMTLYRTRETTDNVCAILFLKVEGQSSDARLKVQVLDVNDNIPQWVGLDTNGKYPAAVSDTTKVHNHVLTVKAIDLDGTSPNRNVSELLWFCRKPLFLVQQNA